MNYLTKIYIKRGSYGRICLARKYGNYDICFFDCYHWVNLVLCGSFQGKLRLVSCLSFPSLCHIRIFIDEASKSLLAYGNNFPRRIFLPYGEAYDLIFSQGTHSGLY